MKIPRPNSSRAIHCSGIATALIFYRSRSDRTIAGEGVWGRSQLWLFLAKVRSWVIVYHGGAVSGLSCVPSAIRPTPMPQAGTRTWRSLGPRSRVKGEYPRPMPQVERSETEGRCRTARRAAGSSGGGPMGERSDNPNGTGTAWGSGCPSERNGVDRAPAGPTARKQLVSALSPA